MSKRYAPYGFVGLLPLVLVGCFGGGTSDQRGGDLAADTSRLVGSPAEKTDYVRVERKSAFGEIEHFTITPDAFNRRKAELSGRQARLLKAGDGLNTRAYLLEGFERSGTVLLEPRVFLRASPGVGPTQFRESRDGNVLVDASIAFVDGLTSTISTGRGAQMLPPEFLVKDRDVLIKSLEEELKQSPLFIAAVPCPDVLKLRSKNTEFTVALQSKLKDCPLNTFFPAVMSFRRDEWPSVAESLTEDGFVQLAMKLDLSVPITTEYAHFKIKKEWVLREVERELAGKSTLLTEVEISKALVGSIKHIEETFEFDAPDTLYAHFRDQVLNDYFVMAEKPNCPDELTFCYGRHGNWNVPQIGEYAFTIQREEYFGKPVTIMSVSAYRLRVLQLIMRINDDLINLSAV